MIALLRRRRRAAPRGPARDAGVVALALRAAVVGYLALLHAAAFRSLLTSPDPVITGRYLLPLIPFYGVAIALAVAWLPRRWAPVAGGVAVSGVAAAAVRGAGRAVREVLCVGRRSWSPSAVFCRRLAVDGRRATCTRERDYARGHAAAARRRGADVARAAGATAAPAWTSSRSTGTARRRGCRPTRTGGAVPLEITITGESGYRARGRAAAGLPVGRRRLAAGAAAAALADRDGLPPQPRRTRPSASRRSTTAGARGRTCCVNGVPSQPGFVIQFAERRPVSILERLPDSVQRMSVLRPASSPPSRSGCCSRCSSPASRSPRSGRSHARLRDAERRRMASAAVDGRCRRSRAAARPALRQSRCRVPAGSPCCSRWRSSRRSRGPA